VTDPQDSSARTARVDAGWLAAQQALAGRAAHELRNTLNGVAVNVEVVRSRLARPGVQPEQVQRFAEAASDQLELLTRQVEALLSLTRASRGPADVGGVIRQLLSLRPPPADTLPPAGEFLTDVDGALVRLALAAALEHGQPTLDANDDGHPRVRVVGAAPFDDETRALLDGAVTVTHDDAPDGASTLTLIFPPRGHSPAETEP
jgi:signal transduction histidine kinase